MSDSDSFIEEVTEEVRRDWLFALMRRFGWIPVLLVLGIVGGAAWNEWQKARDASEARAFGAAIAAAVNTDDAAAELTKVAADGDKRLVTAFLGAAAMLEAGNRDQARAMLEALAADPALPASYRHLAELKALIIGGGDMDAAARAAALTRLAEPGAPYRALALEQLALDLVAAGQTAAAVAGLQALLQEPELTAGLQARVTQLIVALGGTPEAG